MEKQSRIEKASRVKTGQFFVHIAFAVLCMAIAFFPEVSAAGEDSVCARVKIEIKQELTLERQAFDAHMVINNGLDKISLENVKVVVNFADADGKSVRATSDPDDLTALFFIRINSIDKINAVDGSGTVSPSTSADIHWLIIPAPGAAKSAAEGTLYYIGATLSYTIGGDEHVTEVAPDYIRVKPMPEMVLDYFIHTNVYGDDAFTAEIEPIVPFTLGVRVLNTGHGVARKLKIDSAQPRIVDNEQGLIIDFHIEGSEVNGQPANNSLLIDFGDINPGASGVARWIMICSLSGRFVEFTAEFSHADELGGELTSLIDAVNTHFLVHDVLVDLPGRDTIRDFLAKDLGVYEVYESEFQTESVVDQSGSSLLELQQETGTEVSYTLRTPLTAGFMVVQLQDPTNGQKVIKQVIRSDGKRIKTDNVWLSKTRYKSDPWQYFFNLFDVNTTNSYRVVFDDPASMPHPPVLQFIPDRKGAEGRQISFLVEASDPDGTLPLLSASSLPALAAFTDQGNGKGIFDWTPVVGQSGQYAITFIASDGVLSASRRASVTICSVADTDCDGMADDCEMLYFGNLDRDGTGDFDNDGLSDLLECQMGTDPGKKDTDGDGISDGWEVRYGLNPLVKDGSRDNDDDGYTNLEEYLCGSQPNDRNSVPGTVWYVDAHIANSGDGRSWPAPFKTIQEALAAAGVCDQIWVKAAIYKFTAALGIDRTIRIYGGFAGTELKQDERNWHIYTTTLDGQGATACLNVSANAAIDGFVLTRCHGTSGGAAIISSGSVTFANDEFTGNTADLGGAVHNLGAAVSFENCAFLGNSAAHGGAVYNEGTTVTIRNCTFSGNAASTSAGAIASDAASTLTVVNSILWGDRVGAAASEIINSGGTATVTYSIVQGSYPGTGNLDADPQFIDAASGILSLRPTSPCIDRGENTGIPEYDLDLNPRLMDGDGGGAVVDMGAYEYDPVVMDFIGDYYQRILNRLPDDEGSRWWRTGIGQLTSQGVSLNEGFLALAKNFYNSPEYLDGEKSNEDYLTDLYRTFFNRDPDPDGFAFWLGYLNGGLTRNGVMYSFAYSPEFRQLLEETFGSALARPEADLVNDCYRGIMARFPEVAGFRFWVTTMRNAQCAGLDYVKSVSRQLALDFFNSAEYAARNRDSSGYVEDLYDAIMRRGPEPEGFNFWVGVIENKALTRQQLLDQFINSGEFQARVQNVIAAGCMQ
jgi:hypothetical protein